MSAQNNINDSILENNDRRLALLRSSTARVILLVAPAGYGKSTAAHALRAEYSQSAVCDCSEVIDGKDFARRILAALEHEHSANAGLYSELQASISAATTQAECSGIVLAAWMKAPASPSLFIFENAEAIAVNTALASLLTELLNTVPPERRIIVCSRIPLPTRASRYLPPHRLSKVGAEQLALTQSEALDLLAGEDVPQHERDEIVRVAQGWPIVLLLLARLSREGRLASALADVKDLAFEDLFVYLVHEVLGPLDESVKRVMTLCAAVYDLTLDELSLAFGHGALDVERLLRKALLIQRDGDRLRIHPLMREVLLQNDAQWRELTAALAEKTKSLGRFSRAAELYRTAGFDDAAARALSALPLGVLQGGAHAFDLSSLSLTVLEKHPKLIAAAGVHRSDISTERLAATFEALTEHQDPEVIVAVAQAYTGRLTDPARATEVLHHPLVRRAAESSPLVRLQLAGWEETIAVHFGAAAGVHHKLQAAYNVLQSGRFPFHRARVAHYLDVASKRRGHREESLYWAGEAIAAGRECGPRERAALLLAAIYTAWFWGDDDTATAHVAELQTAASATHHPDYAWAMRALDPQTLDSALPLWDASTTLLALIMGAAKRFGRERELLLQRALALCEETGTPCFTTLFARAVSEPHRRVQDCERIIAMADPAELPEWRTAVRSYMQGKPSFLDEFARRFATDGHGEVEPANGPIRLEVLRERVIYEGQTYRLTPREAALLAYLTRHRIGTPREEIQDALWPDLDLLAARDSLYSMLHRLRKRIRGAHQLVEGIGNAYCIDPDIAVDLWTIEDLYVKVQRGKDVAIEVVADACNAIRDRASRTLSSCEWFAPVQFQLSDYRRELIKHLISHAQAQNNHAEVAFYAQELLDADECDEWAHKALINAHLALGQELDAARAYRRYRTVLRRELNLEPTDEMPGLDVRASQ